MDGIGDGSITVDLFEGDLPFVMALLSVDGHHGIECSSVLEPKQLGILYGLLQMFIPVYQ